MSQPLIEAQRLRSMDLVGAALDPWKQRLRELPEVRMEKVRSARGAIRTGYYESEQVLESTLQKLSNDVGVLCRTDSSTGSE